MKRFGLKKSGALRDEISSVCSTGPPPTRNKCSLARRRAESAFVGRFGPRESPAGWSSLLHSYFGERGSKGPIRLVRCLCSQRLALPVQKSLAQDLGEPLNRADPPWFNARLVDPNRGFIESCTLRQVILRKARG